MTGRPVTFHNCLFVSCGVVAAGVCCLVVVFVAVVVAVVVDVVCLCFVLMLVVFVLVLFGAVGWCGCSSCCPHLLPSAGPLHPCRQKVHYCTIVYALLF